jgi:hypothetical protein
LNLRALAVSAVTGLLAAGAGWVIAARPDGRLHVSVLSTGSSPAVLIDTGDGSTVLVDGGSSPTQLLAALGRVLPPATAHLDMVVVTGGEEAAVDRLGGLPGHYSVGTVVTPGNLNPGGNNIVAALEGGGERSRGGWRLVVLRRSDLALPRLHRPRHRPRDVRPHGRGFDWAPARPG